MKDLICMAISYYIMGGSVSLWFLSEYQINGIYLLPIIVISILIASNFVTRLKKKLKI